MGAFGSLLTPIRIALTVGAEHIAFHSAALEEPRVESAYVALKNTSGRTELFAIGDRAKQIRGRTTENIENLRPFENSRISHPHGAAILLKHLLDGAGKGVRLLRPEALVVVPDEFVLADRKVLTELLEEAGMGRVLSISSGFANILGLGLDPEQCPEWLIVDCGASATRVVIIDSRGRTLESALLPGSDALTRSIQDDIRIRSGLEVGDRLAERLKILLGDTASSSGDGKTPIEGSDHLSGRPTRHFVDRKRLVELCRTFANTLGKGIEGVLATRSIETRRKIEQFGVLLVGQGARLRHLDMFLSETRHIPTMLPEDSLTAVILGAQIINADRRRYEHLLTPLTSHN